MELQSEHNGQEQGPELTEQQVLGPRPAYEHELDTALSDPASALGSLGVGAENPQQFCDPTDALIRIDTPHLPGAIVFETSTPQPKISASYLLLKKNFPPRKKQSSE